MATRVALGFIGAGNMAEAIVRGVLGAGLYSPAQVVAADPVAQRRELFSAMGVQAVSETAEAAAGAEILILAVKPQMIDAAAAQMKPVLVKGTLVISIIAGLSAAYLEQALGGGARVMRVMPNTPMLVGAGMSAISGGTHTTEADLAAAERIFGAGGKTVRVEPEMMDAVTATSGSGPAYIFLMTEAMAAAAKELGLSAEDAATLARQTVIGAAKLLAESKDTPAELRRKVTSPKGTTLAAIETFERENFAEVVRHAMAAAAARSKELGR